MSKLDTKTKKLQAICLNSWVTVRQSSGGQFLIFAPSDTTEAGHFVQANEIYLNYDEIKRLTRFAKECQEGVENE